VEAAIDAVLATPVPVIAAIEGPCLGAAVDLALACDVQVAGRTAWLQVPAVRLGLLYNPRAVARLHRTLARATTSRLLLLGERFDAPAAQQAGLVGEVVETGRAVERAAELATRVPLGTRAVRETRALLADLDAGAYRLDHWRQRRVELLNSAERRNRVAEAQDRHHQ
jgi:enoyl-CoA hydratase